MVGWLADAWVGWLVGGLRSGFSLGWELGSLVPWRRRQADSFLNGGRNCVFLCGGELKTARKLASFCKALPAPNWATPARPGTSLPSPGCSWLAFGWLPHARPPPLWPLAMTTTSVPRRPSVPRPPPPSAIASPNRTIPQSRPLVGGCFALLLRRSLLAVLSPPLRLRDRGRLLPLTGLYLATPGNNATPLSLIVRKLERSCRSSRHGDVSVCRVPMGLEAITPNCSAELHDTSTTRLWRVAPWTRTNERVAIDRLTDCNNII